jgi:hypothetical protein
MIAASIAATQDTTDDAPKTATGCLQKSPVSNVKREVLKKIQPGLLIAIFEFDPNASHFNDVAR